MESKEMSAQIVFERRAARAALSFKMRRKFRNERSEGGERPGSEAQLYFRHIQLLDQCLMVRHQNERLKNSNFFYMTCGFEPCTHHKEGPLYSDRETSFDT